MQKTSYFCTLYLLCIGISLGSMLCSGVFTAPTIFRASSIVPELDMSLLQSGILMTSIFVKLNKLLIFLACFIIVYEILSLRKRERIAPLLGLISAVCIFLFTLYYTPYILHAQTLGEDGIITTTFHTMHVQSVYVFKALMISLCLLFILRVRSGCKDTQNRNIDKGSA